MLSMQETKGVAEQPQEEVQLTELLPVKQSRIRENKDVDATDALRALRSLSSDDKSEGFGLFNFCKNVESERPHRRAQKRTNESKDGEEEKDAKRRKKKAPKRRGSRKRKDENRGESDSSECLKAPFDDDDEFGEEKGLYTGKKDCFKDEVYVYRQEPLNPGKGPINRKQATFSDHQPTTDGDLFDKAVHRKDNARKRADDFAEKELRQKIDAIIQANYLLERENNNVAAESSSPLTAMKLKMDQIQAKDSDSSRQPSPLKKYRCVVCDARFKGSGGLRNHYKVLHTTGPAYKCDECGKEFPLKERLKLHVRTHTGFKPYKCPECDKSFARGGQLVQHRRTHSQVKPFRCGLCSNSFTCAANLSLHVKRHNGQKDHKCELCGRAFVRRDALKKHLECLHRDVKSFVCAICNKTFKGHLPQHMRTHARDRPHGCATCGQRFAQKSQLTVHQRTHSGQRPFRCLVCWQAFAHSTALKLHTRRHTGERPFKCNLCNVGFTQLPHWKKHMKCIHGLHDPYGCRRCDSFFRIKSELEYHEKTCHPETEEPETDGDGDGASTELLEKHSVVAKYKLMTVEKMRLLLAVLLQRISKQEKLNELGFGKRLIDDVLEDSLVSAGKEPVTSSDGLSELEVLTRNLEIFLEWTMPKEHWENFRRMKKTPEEILEALTDSPTE
ncbi:PREDICTED: zinc finger protein 37-like [Dinoponera quadriceps]|uniref:Zinc finger protein 37-like n=1 Tax=Dinoponera quadriceps TaxID=609295 RepID=A0A6P3XVI3_DINQU|nr:PREDICTED: zinc finger protein 37-like [Dinoponera quadriceps]